MGDRFPNGIGDPERSGEKEDGDSFCRCHAHQLFLIRPVQCAAAADRRMEVLHLIGKPAECQKNLRLGTLIFHNGTPGPLMDGSTDNLGKSLEIALQQIGLLQRHSGLGHLDPDTAPASVFDDYFHFNLQGQKTGGRSPLSCVWVKLPPPVQGYPQFPAPPAGRSGPWPRPVCRQRSPARWSRFP